MEEERIKAFAAYRDRGLVHFAYQCANISDEEERVFDTRFRNKKTIDETAEILCTTRDTVKRRQRSAMDKLNGCWSGLEWVDAICTYCNIKQ